MRRSVSSIDPTSPADHLPARKAAIRSNFAAAKAEIEELYALQPVYVMPEPSGQDQTSDFNQLQQTIISSGVPAATIHFRQGEYFLKIDLDRRVSIQGEWPGTIIGAPTGASDWIIRVARKDENKKPHGLYHHMSIRNVAINGDDNQKVGLLIENEHGVDLCNVACWKCRVGIHSRKNYYGTWENLRLQSNDIGIEFGAIDNKHGGNKLIVNALIRSNRIGVYAGGRAPLVTFLQGTFESNTAGIFITDALIPFDNGKYGSKSFIIDSAWFENNGGEGGEVVQDDFVGVAGDAIVFSGILSLRNLLMARVHVGKNGKIRGQWCDIGIGPPEAQVRVDLGGAISVLDGYVAEQS